MSGRTPSLTDIALNRTTNIRNTPDIKAAAMQNVTVREPNVLIRSNVNPTGVETRLPVVTSQNNDYINPQPVNNNGTLQNTPNSVKSAGINWLIPILIIGGFFAASKLKKKKKNV